MTHREQIEFVQKLEADGHLEIEKQVRELAVKAAAYNSAGYPDRPRFAMARPGGNFAGMYNSPTAFACDYAEISVDLYPGLTGFARQLVAENIIWEQMEQFEKK